MEAMLCLRMPNAPAERPDCPLSYPSRSSPFLRRHLAFPMGGARVAAARPRRIFAQAPPPSHPEKKDAKRGRAMHGWYRTRAAVVGAAVVLGGALGAACLSHVGRASCSAQNPNTEMPIIRTTEDLFELFPTVIRVSRCCQARLREEPQHPENHSCMLLQLMVDQIREEVRLLKKEPKNFRVLDLLVKHPRSSSSLKCCTVHPPSAAQSAVLAYRCLVVNAFVVVWVLMMSSGDKKTTKGKRFNHSFGNARPPNKKKKRRGSPRILAPPSPPPKKDRFDDGAITDPNCEP